MRITNEEYWNLTPMGRELHDYWMNYKTEMYNNLANSGDLLPILQSRGEWLHEIVVENLQTLGVAGAKEVARSMIYDEMES